MRSLKFATDFMDSAMNNERLNMGEVVGEMTKLQNAWKICIFCNSEKFQRGDPWKKKIFQIFSIILFSFGRAHEPIRME